MIESCFQNIFILGTLISICILPFVVYLVKYKREYNIEHINKMFFIMAIIFLFPIINIFIKSIDIPIKSSMENKNYYFNDYEYSTDLSEENVYTEDSQNDSEVILIENDTIVYLSKYLLYIWIVFSIVMVLYYVVIYNVYIYKLNLYREHNNQLEYIIEDVKNEFKIKRKIEYAFSDKISSPISIGILKKKVIIPKDFEYEDYKYILKHEIFHIKDRDIEYKFYLLLINCIYWFNPIIYYFVNKTNEIIELNCDYNVLKFQNINYRVEYGKVLLKQIEKGRTNGPRVVVNFSNTRREIMERFNNILKDTKTRNSTVIASVLTILLIVSIVLVVLVPNINFAFTGENEQEETLVETKITEEKNEEIFTSNSEVTEDKTNILTESNTEIETVNDNNFTKNDINKELENTSRKIDVVIKEVNTVNKEIDAVGIPVETINIETETKVSSINDKNIEIMSFINPLKGSTITNRFGQTRVENTHQGIDLATGDGKDIVAVADGTVTMSEYSGANGNMVIINHGNGVETYYSHCSKLCVKEGDTVKQGDLIANVGSTGNSTGPHLHFEIHINNIAVNPEKYIKF